MKNESTALARLREIKRREIEWEKERADSDLNIIFLVFCCGPRMSFTAKVRCLCEAHPK